MCTLISVVKCTLLGSISYKSLHAFTGQWTVLPQNIYAIYKIMQSINCIYLLLHFFKTLLIQCLIQLAIYKVSCYTLLRKNRRFEK